MKIQRLFYLIHSDYKRLLSEYRLKHSFATFFKIILTPSFIAVYLYRWARFFYVNKMRFIARIVFLINMVLTGSDIAVYSDIDEGFMLIHPTGTIMGCKMGKNGTVCGQTTIGTDRHNYLDIGAGPGAPVIGDNFFIGIGSKVLGPITIGNNAVVGVSSLVLKPVGDGMMVFGTPARVVPGGSSRTDLS